MTNKYLISARKEFERYKALGEKTFDQLSDEKLNWQYNQETNSISTLVKHLCGNMLSRWTNFLSSDGEKEWRNRDEEFENDILSRSKLLEKWNSGWNCLFNALDSLTADDLEKEVFVRNEAHTVIEAINRNLAHYAYHIGQMVYIGKMACGNQWTSLSIPKGKSEVYNAEKFLKRKTKKN